MTPLKSYRRTYAGKSQIFHAAIFSVMCPLEQGKNKQMGPHQNKKGTDCMGEYICQWYIEQGFNLQNI